MFMECSEVIAKLRRHEAELKRLAETGVLVTHRRALEPEVAVKPSAEPGQAA